MPKSSEKRILKDEEEILRILKTNGHESIDVLAKKCGFSRQKVWRIIKRLENENIIWGYSTIYERERYNLKHFIMLAKRNTTPVDQNMIQEILSTKLDNILPDSAVEIENIEFTHGPYDGVFSFFAPDLITAKKFCDRFLARYNKFVSNVDLIEGIFFMRNQAVKNPNIKKVITYL
jgi:DNA-binding Lrp family transcriptional regulator